MTDRQRGHITRANCLLVAAALLTVAGRPRSTTAQSSVAKRSAPVSYGIGRWNADSLGNHRVQIHVGTRADAVRVHIPWRRRDEHPEGKNVIMTDAATGARIMNVAPLAISRESGDLAFEPSTAPGDYYLYFMPYRRLNKSANYPKIVYQAPGSTADGTWLRRNHLLDAGRGGEWRVLPAAEVVAYQSADSLDAFTSMEIIATADETRALLARVPTAAYLVFPEDRAHPIRMATDLPQRWIAAGPSVPFRGSAHRGEFFVFQFGLYAARQRLDDVRVGFGALTGPGGARHAIPPSALRCFDTGGVDSKGRPFATRLSVDSGHVQPLWIGIDVPDDARAGLYQGFVAVRPQNAPPSTVPVRIRVERTAIAAHGDDDPNRLARLRWLDSRLAIDDGLVPPYVPVTLHGDTISLLGRSVVVGPDGLPRAILSRFTDGNTRIGHTPRDVIAAPLSILVDTGGGVLTWHSGGGGGGGTVRFMPRPPGAIEWTATTTTSDGGLFTMATHARLEFDGNIEYRVALSAARTVDVRDIRLVVPYAPTAARYMMGLGQPGGARPRAFHWKWDVQKNQDAVWIGDVTAGMQVSLKDEHYSRPLNTNFYHVKPLVMPVSWSNSGRGGCDVADRDRATVVLSCYSGPRTLHAGDTLHYDFRLLVTPFRAIDTREHFTDRYFHAFAPIDSVAASGANVINVHHATAINPFLNYPFLRPREMRAYVDRAHARGMKVKIYYTVRELSDHAPELFALRSLGHEVFSAGAGGGPSWLQEHFGADYTAGWFVPEKNDATVVTNGESRWHNSYVEGLDWLARNIGIDGLYLDDVAFDRGIMQRVRKVLDRRGGASRALIDLHSATQYDPLDGFASSANLYMEYFPYIDRLWFGEGFDYTTTRPDYWLVELSGIPFGLMGEMLQGGGNPWRGMVYGMTNRIYAGDPTYHGDPRAIWQLWDAFRIADSKMSGYWDRHPLVRTGRDDVPATTYARPGRVLVALGSWATDTARVRLAVDWKAVGIDSAHAVVRAPAVAGFQKAAIFSPGAAVPVAPGRGLLLLISPR